MVRHVRTRFPHFPSFPSTRRSSSQALLANSNPAGFLDFFFKRSPRAHPSTAVYFFPQFSFFPVRSRGNRLRELFLVPFRFKSMPVESSLYVRPAFPSAAFCRLAGSYCLHRVFECSRILPGPPFALKPPPPPPLDPPSCHSPFRIPYVFFEFGFFPHGEDNLSPQSCFSKY